MSDFDPKSTPTTPGRAQRTLASLKKARGFVVLGMRDGAPSRVRIDTAKGTWSWVLVSGSGKKDDSLWQLEHIREDVP